MGAATVTTLALVLLVVFSRYAVPAVAFISIAALTGFAVNPVAISLAVKFAKDAPTLATAFSASSFNVGIAVSSALASVALDSSLGLQGPAIVGAFFAAITLVPLLSLAVMHFEQGRRTPSGIRQPRAHENCS
ncbi:hypothetical protein AB0I81_17570 [Nonomuraea sp. NPDC050404]|uniref:hypothetical protein n=1 Tax=Nonomuraea sp. NPDC050404 TaxID=3155783 RepID=UPI00340FD7E9